MTKKKTILCEMCVQLQRVPEFERLFRAGHGSEQRGRESADADVGAAAFETTQNVHRVRRADRTVAQPQSLPDRRGKAAAAHHSLHASPSERSVVIAHPLPSLKSGQYAVSDSGQIIGSGQIIESGSNQVKSLNQGQIIEIELGKGQNLPIRVKSGQIMEIKLGKGQKC